MHTGSQSNKFTGLRVAGVLMATHTPFPTTASSHRRTDTCGSSTGITRTAISRLRFASFFRKGAREERRRLKPNPYRARAPEDAESRSNKRGIIFCQARRSSVFFLVWRRTTSPGRHRIWLRRAPAHLVPEPGIEFASQSL